MNTAVIVAAGRGTRMGPDVDKLFLHLAGAPVVAHTWRRFDACPAIDEIILVVRDGLQGAFRELARDHVHPTKPWRLVAGGRERQDSVWNGLAAIDSEGLVAVQDGARPCTPLALITECLQVAERVGASVAAQRATDTVKEGDDAKHIVGHLDRSRLWTVQTPQCFRVGILRRALAAVRDQGGLVTDDTAACGAIGQGVEMVESVLPNPKVTGPADLPYVELLLRSQAI